MEEVGVAGQTQKPMYQEPLERQRCTHRLTSGARCGRWADRDKKLCHAHHSYAETYGRHRVDVPLLEDEESIVFVLSQTAQALASAAMPPGNGLAIIGACKLATRLLALKLQQARDAARREVEKRREAPHAAEVAPNAGTEPDAGTEPGARNERDEGTEPDAGTEPGEGIACQAVAECDEEEGASTRAFEEARAASEAVEAEREYREGPKVRLPRFRREDLDEQWERGTEGAVKRIENNFFLSKGETQRIMEWQRKHPAEMRARHERMLDIYFGRVKGEGNAGA